MKTTAIIVFIYAILIALGGIIGGLKAGSNASLISGSVFGAALLLCAYLIYRKQSAAQYVALALIFILDGIFTYRFAKTLHFFPAGFLSLVSLVVLIVVALKSRRKALG